ncbi:hypothetical protein DM02DRAFT_627760 [Periconia macrospinosa]|uniref:Uncharacterized protein n=1 Tax=Periconia macrospinosa TaxID=97972 RepID=A0A2V1DTB1_9PLEO|nr:hypothetical protein DM02DRAFT_627760 [Periconia macrospinosa]
MANPSKITVIAGTEIADWDPREPRAFFTLAPLRPEYHEWIKNGGLAAFNAKHNLQENETIYEAEMRKIPAIQKLLDAANAEYEKAGPFVSAEAARKSRVLREGFSSGSENEVDDRQTTPYPVQQQITRSTSDVLNNKPYTTASLPSPSPSDTAPIFNLVTHHLASQLPNHHANES